MQPDNTAHRLSVIQHITIKRTIQAAKLHAYFKEFTFKQQQGQTMGRQRKNKPDSKCEDKSGSSGHDDLVLKATLLPL